jgi:hypothetical protein
MSSFLVHAGATVKKLIAFGTPVPDVVTASAFRTRETSA